MFLDFVLNSIIIAIPLFCIATMFAIGLNTTFEEAFVAPLRNLLALAIVILVNNVFVPLVGIIALIVLGTPPLASVVSIGDPMSSVSPAFGFLLLMLASGTLFGPALATISGAEKSFAKGILVILIVISALLIPLLLQLMQPLGVVEISTKTGATIFGTIFGTLLTYQLIPLLLGMIIKVQYDAIAVRVRPLIMQLTGLTFLIMLVLLTLAALEDIMSLPPAIIAYSIVALIVAVLTMTIGYYGGVAVRNVVKASNEDIPRSLATSTTTRNVSFVLILLWVAFSNLPSGTDADKVANDGQLILSVTVVLIIYMISLLVSAHQAVQWGKAEAKKASQDNGEEEVAEAAN